MNLGVWWMPTALDRLVYQIHDEESKIRDGVVPEDYWPWNRGHSIALFDSDLPDRIWGAVKDAESKTTARHLDPSHVDEIINALGSYPSGEAWASGGARRRKSGKFSRLLALIVEWFVFRKRKIVNWSVVESDASRSPVPVLYGPGYSIETDNSRWIRRALLQKRTVLAQHLKIARQLRPLGVRVPDGEILEKAVEIFPHARIALVQALNPVTYQYLLTPLGFCKVSWRVRSVTGAFEEITGRRLPKNATWEKIEPLFVMAALAK